MTPLTVSENFNLKIAGMTSFWPWLCQGQAGSDLNWSSGTARLTTNQTTTYHYG
jgi:hypothetical protein